MRIKPLALDDIRLLGQFDATKICSMCFNFRLSFLVIYNHPFAGLAIFVVDVLRINVAYFIVS